MVWWYDGMMLPSTGKKEGISLSFTTGRHHTPPGWRIDFKQLDVGTKRYTRYSLKKIRLPSCARNGAIRLHIPRTAQRELYPKRAKDQNEWVLWWFWVSANERYFLFLIFFLWAFSSNLGDDSKPCSSSVGGAYPRHNSTDPNLYRTIFASLMSFPLIFSFDKTRVVLIVRFGYMIWYLIPGMTVLPILSFHC